MDRDLTQTQLFRAGHIVAQHVSDNYATRKDIHLPSLRLLGWSEIFTLGHIAASLPLEENSTYTLERFIRECASLGGPAFTIDGKTVVDALEYLVNEGYIELPSTGWATLTDKAKEQLIRAAQQLAGKQELPSV